MLTAPGRRPAPRRRGRLPAEVLVPGGPFTMGTSAPSRGRWTTSGPRTRSRWPAFWLDTVPVTNGDYQEFIADGGYDDPRWWTRPAGRTGSRPGSPRRCSGGGTASSGCAAGSAGSEPVPADEPVHARVLVRGRRLRPLGRARLPTEAEWEKAARHDPATGRSGSYPWGDDDPDRRARPTSASATCSPAPVGAYPAGASPLRRPAADRRRLGVDVQRLRRLPGLRGLAVPGVLGGVLRPRVQGAARWVVRAPTAVACRGTFRNWDYPIRRQIFAGFRVRPRRAARARAELMCRHLAYLGRAGAAAARCSSTRRTRLVPAVLGAARGSGTAWSTPTGSASAGTSTGDPDAGPLPAATGPIWADETFADLARVRPHRRGAGRGARRRPPAWPGGEAAARAVPVAAAGCSATTAPSTGWPGVRVRAGWGAAPGAAARAGGADRLGAAVGAGRCTGCDAGATPRRGAGRDGRRGSGDGRGGRLNLLLTDGGDDRGDAPGATRLCWLRCAGRRGRRLRAVRRRARLEPTSPTAPLLDRRPASRTSPRCAAAAARDLAPQSTRGATTHESDYTYRPTTCPPTSPTAACAPTSLAGLTATPKSLPPKWFYDKVGSELFEEITRLPEYYPTRAERGDPAARTPPRSPR